MAAEGTCIKYACQERVNLGKDLFQRPIARPKKDISTVRYVKYSRHPGPYIPAGRRVNIKARHTRQKRECGETALSDGLSSLRCGPRPRHVDDDQTKLKVFKCQWSEILRRKF